jgi:hypothetical protein
MIVKKIKTLYQYEKFTLNQDYNGILTKIVIHVSIKSNIYQ